jgi:citrate lyase alpha subunit
MKTYNAAVVVESEVTIRINPNVDTDELIKEFSECIFRVETIEELVEFASSHIARGEPSFIEGIGYVEYDYGQEWKDHVIMQYTIWTDVSTEIVD